MLAPRTRLLVAVLLTVLLGVGMYLTSTTGIEALRASDEEPSSIPGRVPDFVYPVPETVPTTGGYGPVGRVALVFPGRNVSTGLVDELERPWIAVSAVDGDYRALEAPHRPAPARDVIAVSAEGDLLAWGYDGGVVVYDTVRDDAREVGRGLGRDVRALGFSQDARHLTAYDGALRVVEVRTGEVVATLTGIDEQTARHAVWTSDGEAVSYVADGRLVRHEWATDTRTGIPTRIDPRFGLSWNSDGTQLATMREQRGVRFVEVYDVRPGRLELATRLRPEGFAQQDFLGFSGDRHVAVHTLRADVGPSDFIYDLPVDGGPPSLVTQLPAPGGNWLGPGYLEVASGPLAGGSYSFEEPSWPWSDRAKLTFSTLSSVFVLGLYLTRPANRPTRWWSRRRR